MFRFLIITLVKLRKLLQPHQQKKVLLVLLLVLFNVISELFGIAFVFPVLLMIIKNDFVYTNPYVFEVYNYLGFTSKESFIVAALVIILIVFVIKNTLFLVISYFQFRTVYNLATEFSILLFKTKFNSPYEKVIEENSIVASTNISSVPVQVMQNTLMSVLYILSEFTIAVVISLAIAIYNFQVFILILITLLPILWLIFRFTKKKSEENGKLQYEAQLSANIYLYESIRGFVDVKIFQRESFFLNKYITNQKKSNRIQPAINVIQLLTLRVLEIIIILALLLVVGYNFFIQKSHNEDLLILLGLFVTAAYRLMPSANKIISSFLNIKQSIHLFDLVNQYDRNLDTNVFFEETAISTHSLKFEKDIQFEQVSFSYSQNLPPALNNISFGISKNERIGIIGKSGSGKTTLINLLLRFYIEQHGKIKVDGVTIGEKNMSEWRSLIGYVSQSIFIFDGTLQENIAFGIEEEKVDVNKIFSCITDANLGALFAKLPEGLKEKIGENGVKLSGGERQRIAIARALYSGAQILIFDEATSALDSETEKEITESIYNLSKSNITMIIIAHRITTLNNCDRILEISNGKLVKEYSYSQLIKEKMIENMP